MARSCVLGTGQGLVEGDHVMSSAVDALGGGHTRWGRVIIAVIPALVVVLLLAGSMITGLLAATFALGGVPIDVRAATLDATGMGLYGDTRSLITGDAFNVAAAGVEEATITGLCLGIEVPVGAGFNIVLSAPDDVEVNASNLLLDADSLRGSLSATGLEVGRDASVMDRGGVTGPAGTDAVQVAQVELGDATIAAHRLSAGTISLSDISIAVQGADGGC